MTTQTPAQTPPPKSIDKNAAIKEIASRALSKRSLLPFIQRMNPRYMAGWVHEDICRRLERFSEAVEAGLSPRLMLLMPPRHGKSEIASKTFPAWHLGRYPDHEVIACSYNVSLAMGFSRKVQALLDDPAYQTVFDARLNPNQRAAEEWTIHHHRGGYVAAGVGGGITGKGAHCLPAGTMVATKEGNIDIEHLYRLKYRPEVYSFDRAGKVVAKRVAAFSVRESTDLYELTTKTGVKLVLTGDHPVYLPDTDEFVRADHLETMYGTPQSNDRPEVHGMREGFPETALRPQQITEAKLPRVLLLQGVQPSAPRNEECQGMRAVPSTSHVEREHEPQREVLQPELLAGSAPETRKDLPAVRGKLRTEEQPHNSLLTGVRQRGAQPKNDRGGELALQARHELLEVVRLDAPADHGARCGLRSVQENNEASHTPCGSQSGEQLRGEFGSAMQCASHGAPQIEYDTLVMVSRVRSGPVLVYDLEVEDTHNFFANGVCVHNCLIIDDPIKNAEEADSADLREKLMDWYGSTAYTRLAPGGGVLVVQTWWHDGDLAGQLQTAMAVDSEADQFEIVKYPAIAEQAEFIDTETDMIVRVNTETSFDQEKFEKHGASYAAILERSAYRAAQDAGHDPAKLRYLRPKGGALHYERYDVKKLRRIKAVIHPRHWSALYQQNPVPDDGSYFTKDQFKRAVMPPPNALKDNPYIHMYHTWDFAISEKQQNDFTVGTVGFQDDQDQINVAEVIRFKSGDAFVIVDTILATAKRWYHPSLILGFEDGQIFRSIEALLKKRMEELNFFVPYEVLRPLTDKMARARPLQGRMQQGRVTFNVQGEWYDTVRNEMLRFPAGVHDDCVDSLAWLVQLIIDKPAPTRPTPPKPPSWKDGLHKQSRGSGHMAA